MQISLIFLILLKGKGFFCFFEIKKKKTTTTFKQSKCNINLNSNKNKMDINIGIEFRDYTLLKNFKYDDERVSTVTSREQVNMQQKKLIQKLRFLCKI